MESLCERRALSGDGEGSEAMEMLEDVLWRLTGTSGDSAEGWGRVHVSTS